MAEEEDRRFLLSVMISVPEVRAVQTPVLTAGAPLCVCPQCNSDYVPVCGSNGESFQNECYLRQAACKQQSEILVAAEGSCATGRSLTLAAPCTCWGVPHPQTVSCFLLSSSENNSDHTLARQACIPLYKDTLFSACVFLHFKSFPEEKIYRKDVGRFYFF